MRDALDQPVERPRAVFLEACRALGSRLANSGFESHRGYQDLTRSRPPWRHRIGIASSHYNKAGVSVAISPTAVVQNHDLALWRQAKGLWRTDNFVTSRRLGRFVGPGASWNLADPTTRQAVVDEVGTILERQVLPWFDLFDDRLEVLDRWNFEGEVLELDELAELLAFAGRVDEVPELVRKAMSLEPWIRFPPKADVFKNLRCLAHRFSLTLSLPAAPDLAAEAAQVARMNKVLDDYWRRVR
jgi:hypothetical protein